MYKAIKLTVDILFLIVSATILVYLYLLNMSRPTCVHDHVLPAVPRMAWAPHDALPLTPMVVAANKTTYPDLLLKETAHG